MEREPSSSKEKTSSAPSPQSKVLLTIRMEREELEWAKDFTKQAGINVSHLVRTLLGQFRREVESNEVKPL